MNTHTPGPWAVRVRRVDGEVVDCFVTAPDCQGLAYDAEILGDDEYRDGLERKLADCNLVASAPELLAALHNMLEDGDKTDRAQAIAAIKKATGEQP